MAKEVEPVTLADVAKRAGVSIATASKAINGREHVRAQTRERVQAAVQELNYRPNVFAQRLHSKRSGTIGLVTHDLEGRFSIPTLMGAEDEAGTGQLSVLLCDARGDQIRERYHVRALLDRRVDGLIIVGARPDPRPSLGELPVPVVYAYAPSMDPNDMSQVSDNVAAGGLVVDHLIERGRRRIAILGGDKTYGAARDRAEGAMAALKRASLEPVDGRAWFGSWDEAWGRTGTETLLSKYPDIDGIVCGSDQIARGCLDALREMGRTSPEDVAVTGHDNWEILVRHSRPSLTSVDMNLEQLGRRAAARLFAAIEGEHSAGIETVECKLVARESTQGYRST